MNYQFKQLHSGGGADLWLVTWQDIKEKDEIPAWENIGIRATVEVIGDADGVEILGSIMGGEFSLLNDPDGLPLVFPYPSIKSCGDMFTAIKPRKVGLGKATVAILIRRN